MGMRHLITGGSGFFGNLLAKQLLAKGESVRILDVWDDPSRPKEIEYVEADIRNRDKVSQALRGIDIVHHNAALVPLTKAKKPFFEVNAHGSRIVAEESVKSGIKAFVYMSSSALFAKSQSPIYQHTLPAPIEAYGQSKLAGEQEVSQILNAHSIPLIIIRPRTILGEGRMGIFQILFDWIRTSKNVYIIGDGNVLFQFVHAHDLMDAYMLILEKKQYGTYNVGTDQYSTLRKDLEALIRYAGTKSKVVGLPRWLTVNGLRILYSLSLSPLVPLHYLTYGKELYFDLKPLKDLGWTPKYSNEAMLRESYDAFLRLREEPTSNHMNSVHRKPVREKILWLIKQFSSS
jgi:nucleoside-diphosphate-sugar epimerase